MGYFKGGFFVERELFYSNAFKALNRSGLKILLYVLDSRVRENKAQAKTKKGTTRKPRFVNLDNLYIPYSVAVEKTGLTRPSVTAGIDEVLAKGFLELKYHGGAAKHDMSIYSWNDSWMFWQPGVTFFKRPTRPRRGFQDGAWRKRHRAEVIELNAKSPMHGNT